MVAPLSTMLPQEGLVERPDRSECEDGTDVPGIARESERRCGFGEIHAGAFRTYICPPGLDIREYLGKNAMEYSFTGAKELEINSPPLLPTLQASRFSKATNPARWR